MNSQENTNELIIQFKKAIHPSLDWILQPFDIETKEQNPVFYRNTFDNNCDLLNKQIDIHPFLTENQNDLKNINLQLCLVSKKVVELFSSIEYFEPQNEQSVKQNLLIDTFFRIRNEILNSLNNSKIIIPDIIKHQIEYKNYQMAIDFKNHFLKTIDTHLYTIKRNGIHIDKTPLNDIYNDLIDEIKKSIDKEELNISLLINNKQPQQPEPTTKVEVKENQHSNIFVNNAFEVWQQMFLDFKIIVTSRTDIRFMFDAMKFDKLIHNNITQKNILDWISETHSMTIEKPNYKNHKTDIKRNVIYNNAKANHLN